MTRRMTVGGGALHIPAAPGDIYGDINTAKNLVLRAAPTGAWTATTKVAFEGTNQYHQAGMILYTDDGNFVKFGRIATENGDRRREVRVHPRDQRDAAQRGGGLDGQPAGELPEGLLPADGLRRDQRHRRVLDRRHRPGRRSAARRPIPAGAKIGMFAFNNAAAASPVADFDWFRLESAGGGGGGTPSGPSRDDDFSGTSLDKSRWNAIVRDNPAKYAVGGGNLTITTELGDIYTGDTNPPPNNFILQSADHAGADWVIETKLSGDDHRRLRPGRPDRLRATATTTSSSTRSPTPATRGSTASSCARRSAARSRTRSRQTSTCPAGTTNIWLRLKKAGTTYTGEYSFDGDDLDAGRGHGAERDGGAELRPVRVRPAGAGRRRHGVVRLLHARRAGPARRVRLHRPRRRLRRHVAGHRRSGTRSCGPTPSKIAFADGDLKVTTVLGDIYTNGDPSGTRNFLLQSADHIGKEDYVLETKVDVSQLNGGYAQGGILVRTDDDNYVKFDAISDVDNPKFNRIELRSEQAGAILNPQPRGHDRVPGRRQRRLAAPDQDRHDLQGRVLARRLDLDGAVGHGHQHPDQRGLRPLHARRADRRSRRRLRVLQGRRLDRLPAHRGGEQRAGDLRDLGDAEHRLRPAAGQVRRRRRPTRTTTT